MKREIIVATFWLLFAGYIAYASYQLGLGAGGRPGAGFFPFGAALGIGVVGLLRLLGVNRDLSEARTTKKPDEWKKIFSIVGGMLAFALLLDLLGFAICTFLLLAFYLKMVAAQPWQRTLIFAGASAVGAHLFFDVLLRAQLPRGLLAFLA